MSYAGTVEIFLTRFILNEIEFQQLNCLISTWRVISPYLDKNLLITRLEIKTHTISQPNKVDFNI